MYRGERGILRHDNETRGEHAGGLRAKITGWWLQGRSFFNDVRGELKKVSWPTREEVFGSTKVVLVMVALVAIVIFLLDRVFENVLDLFRLVGR